MKDKPKITIASYGTVDECEHCHKEYTTGICAWIIESWKSINLCLECLNEYYDYTSSHMNR